MPIAEIRGVKINYEVVGDSGPYMALITGGRRGYAEFVPLAKKIAVHGYRVVLHDRRNTGASDIRIEGEDGEEEIWADDLVALLKHIGAPLPCFIGGSSAGARMSVLVYLRHPEAVRALLLMRVTGGEFAFKKLPPQYYGQFIDAAKAGGMAAVCAHEQYKERITANPENGKYLMAMDPKEYIRVMSHWLDIFTRGPVKPMMGVAEEKLRAIKVPAILIPGNDLTHSMEQGRAIQKVIPGCKLHELPLEDTQEALVPFGEWEPQEPEIAQVFATFMDGVKA